MKIKYKIKFAIDGMLLHGRKLVGNIALCVLTILLIAVFFLMNEMNANLRKDLEETLKNDCDKAGYVIKNDIYGVESVTALDLMELECIDAAGEWHVLGCTLESLSSLREIQQNHVQEEMNYEMGYLETIDLDATAWGMFRFSLCEGMEPGEVAYEQDMNVLYLGYQYKDKIPVGTVFSDETGDYVVAGILDRGCTIPDESLHLLSKFSVSSAYSLDYAVINVLFQDSDVGITYFSVEDGYTFEDAADALQQLAKEKNISLTVSSIDAKLTTVEQSLKPINQYMVQILFVIGITLCIVFTCFQTVAIILRKSEYGILYANGATTRDLVDIIIIENVIKFLISIIIIIPLLLLIAKHFFVISYADSHVIQSIILKSISWRVLIIGFLVVIVSAIIPVHTIKKYAPVELIGAIW